jgi:uridylate kinase
MVKYKRVLLKLTGESLVGIGKTGIDFESVASVAMGIKRLLADTSVQLAIVIGGGNLFRGRNYTGKEGDPAQIDFIGMMGTVMNALALGHELEVLDIPVRVMSALRVEQACEPFIRKRAIHHLEKGNVVIFGGGTGSPFFTTDTAAALKASEINADLLLKGTNVDGVYDKDPKTNKDATRYLSITFTDALAKGLTVMDASAFDLCRTRKIPVVVFNIADFANVGRIIRGEKIGTLITP